MTPSDGSAALADQEPAVRPDVGGWISGPCLDVADLDWRTAQGSAGAAPPRVGPVIMAGFTSVMHLVVAASPPTITVTLPGTTKSVPIARRLVRATLAGCPRAGDLMLAVTELAANAISHSASGQGGSFTVWLRTEPSWARIEVTDGGPADGQPAAGNGWGLAIVAGVTDRAGAIIEADGSRTGWAEVAW